MSGGDRIEGSVRVNSRARRRQFGTGRRNEPLPPVATPVSLGTLALGRLAIMTSLLALIAFAATVVGPEVLTPGPANLRERLEAVGYFLLVSLLTLSSLAYLVARQGYLRRTRSHRRVPRAELEEAIENDAPSLTVLVPSYREDQRTNLLTLMSAALQEFPALRVVLLIDDPPNSDDPEHRKLLDAARSLPASVSELLEEPRIRFTRALDEVLIADRTSDLVDEHGLNRLIEDYEYAADWLGEQARDWPCADHVDDFFVEHVLRALAADLSIVASALRGALVNRATIRWTRCVQLRRRLASIFTVEITSFERKRFLSLSDEPNKAMNLNSYLSLMGASLIEQRTSAGDILIRCEPQDPAATLVVPMTDYVLTLDADSIVLPEYCLRLVHILERPENSRAGIAQTPYSAFPGAATRVERLAGATTDLQHIVHQGMADHGAGYWVGANAILRMRAILELRTDDDSEGRMVTRFLSDRTVIEDTESTLDLTSRGWQILNYPERLAYSASPPDFGSLCVQRRRWANGGLMILPKLRGHWRSQKQRGEKRSFIELGLRLNYLASITWSTIGLMLLLAYPYRSRLLSVLVVMMAAPYFLAMASDLKRSGYKRTDVIRVYGFNLVMLPVNAMGVLQSLGQIITGHKMAFARTPKVRDRTVAPALFVIFPWVLVGLAFWAMLSAATTSRWSQAIVAGVNLLVLLGAIISLIGIRNSVADVWLGFVAQLRRPAPRLAQRRELDPIADWEAVLYHGSTDRPRSSPRRIDSSGTVSDDSGGRRDKPDPERELEFFPLPEQNDLQTQES
ncbi:MAG: glycosyltransferase [Actinobacteria bacterium]|nr:glycosyltransferase [Actinomycetota bacterium]